MADWLIEPPQQPEQDAQVITLEEAIAVVVTVGEKVRECPKCQSKATDIGLLAYEKREGYTHAYVSETCHDCGNEVRYYLHATHWFCCEAMRCWEGVKTATALFRSEQQAQADLDALDIPRDPPA